MITFRMINRIIDNFRVIVIVLLLPNKDATFKGVGIDRLDAVKMEINEMATSHGSSPQDCGVDEF